LVSEFSLTSNAYRMCTYIFKTFCILKLNDGSLINNISVLDSNTSLVFNIKRHNAMSQSEIEISSEHGGKESYLEEH